MVQKGGSTLLSIARPTKRKGIGVHYFRKCIPADLISIVGHRENTLCLKTKDPSDARKRHAKAQAKFDQRWEGCVPSRRLTQRQIMRLAGVLCFELTASLSDKLGSESMRGMCCGFIENFESQTPARFE